ncbi:MAG TPA: 30S ribosomal protein S3 [Candidatus Limnocylindrales bacterium]|nr:30S ribosomal protein S3 [Candidatus Limnocylindrales bacterium]
MGQKVNPIGLRLGIIKTWNSKWYAEKNYADLLHEDLKIRNFVKDKLSHAGISKVEIERAAEKTTVNIHTARPGIIIGRKGAEVDKLKKSLQALTGKQIQVNIYEVRRAELDAQLVAENIALQLERRVSFRRAMKRSVSSAMRLGAYGIKVSCSGRLDGSEMARTEWYREGRVPLHTLRADIDYGFSQALTTYGLIGVKVWIFKGEVLSRNNQSKEQNQQVQQGQSGQQSQSGQKTLQQPAKV